MTRVERPVRSKNVMFQSTTPSSVELVPAMVCCDCNSGSIMTRISALVLLARTSSKMWPCPSLTALYKLSSALPLTDIVMANAETSDERTDCNPLRNISLLR
jgi:hypothetical protein